MSAEATKINSIQIALDEMVDDADDLRSELSETNVINTDALYSLTIRAEKILRIVKELEHLA